MEKRIKGKERNGRRIGKGRVSVSIEGKKEKKWKEMKGFETEWNQTMEAKKGKERKKRKKTEKKGRKDSYLISLIQYLAQL